MKNDHNLEVYGLVESDKGGSLLASFFEPARFESPEREVKNHGLFCA